jgi:hypothetical protein
MSEKVPNSCAIDVCATWFLNSSTDWGLYIYTVFYLNEFCTVCVSYDMP